MAKTGKPNILIIWGDDIGWFNVSMNNNGIMGYRTPNIDRREGRLQLHRLVRSAELHGRTRGIHHRPVPDPHRTDQGRSCADLGLQPEDPTIADALPLGYVSGQFGKNHLGDRDEFLPTAHGFDEFFGNLYHLNAEQEPENPIIRRTRSSRRSMVRGVLLANADGTQKIDDTGPLTIKRMETVDGEFLDASLKFMEKAVKDDKPFFCWWNSTRMHIFTHLKKESEGKTGLGIYPDGMVEHDGHVGTLLDKLDELGITDNTVVMLDRQRSRGDELARWRYHAVPGREGHELRGGWRVPCAIRWPGVLKPGTVSNDVFSPPTCSQRWPPPP